nr:immunoglobulin heavy chain junction region [Macaca mulatta]MOV49815.1 immunoglobulin heavy chain junction region [Macaca mulatta]MOV50478.1 immunoglobulin heavy chain junction region [Macaca mulatta]MOV50874.1 immunoglobulin heavy chain junction region [Macaca mulatta]MOV50885.1 immunoglobulin heavy chain junction region [Macaca mulatta]
CTTYCTGSGCREGW